MSKISRAVAVVVAVLAVSLLAVGCSSQASPSSTSVAAPVVTNDLIPADQNVSACVGTLELPNCGSAKRSDVRMYLTFAALMLGMTGIGWRIAVAVRRRDREMQVPEHTF